VTARLLPKRDRASLDSEVQGRLSDVSRFLTSAGVCAFAPS